MAEIIKVSKVGSEYKVDYDTKQVAQNFTIVLPDVLVRVPVTSLLDAIGAEIVINMPITLSMTCSVPIPIGELVASWDEQVFETMWELREHYTETWEKNLKDADPLLIKSLQFQALANSLREEND